MTLRHLCVAAGLLLLAIIWLAPVEALLPRFPVHMLRHMVLVAVAAPLLVLGFPWLGRALAISPLLAAGLEFVLVWTWHLPAAHGLSYRSTPVFVVEQGTFLLAGLLVWAGCLRSAATHDTGEALVGAGGLLLTSMHMTLLGALLTLAPRDVYAAFCGLPSDLSAQSTGGMLMLAIGTPIYLVAGVALAARALSEQKAPI